MKALQANNLKLDMRECSTWRLPDRHVRSCRVAGVIRKHRPKMILALLQPADRARSQPQRPPQVGQIIANAFNLAHLAKAPVEGDPYQALAIYFYFIPPGTVPTFIVDISDHIEDWLAAIDCHLSQFYHPTVRVPQARRIRANRSRRTRGTGAGRSA